MRKPLILLAYFVTTILHGNITPIPSIIQKMGTVVLKQDHVKMVYIQSAERKPSGTVITWYLDDATWLKKTFVKIQPFSLIQHSLLSPVMHVRNIFEDRFSKTMVFAFPCEKKRFYMEIKFLTSRKKQENGEKLKKTVITIYGATQRPPAFLVNFLASVAIKQKDSSFFAKAIKFVGALLAAAITKNWSAKDSSPQPPPLSNSDNSPATPQVTPSASSTAAEEPPPDSPNATSNDSKKPSANAEPSYSNGQLLCICDAPASVHKKRSKKTSFSAFSNLPKETNIFDVYQVAEWFGFATYSGDLSCRLNDISYTSPIDGSGFKQSGLLSQLIEYLRRKNDLKTFLEKFNRQFTGSNATATATICLINVETKRGISILVGENPGTIILWNSINPDACVSPFQGTPDNTPQKQVNAFGHVDGSDAQPSPSGHSFDLTPSGHHILGKDPLWGVITHGEIPAILSEAQEQDEALAEYLGKIAIERLATENVFTLVIDLTRLVSESAKRPNWIPYTHTWKDSVTKSETFVSPASFKAPHKYSEIKKQPRDKKTYYVTETHYTGLNPLKHLKQAVFGPTVTHGEIPVPNDTT